MEQAGLGKDVIVFYDFEYDTVKKAKAKGVTLGKNECIAFTKAFCEYVESHGYKAGVYSNIDYHRNMYSDEVLSKYVYWLADYTGSPDYDCAFHQYTSFTLKTRQTCQTSLRHGIVLCSPHASAFWTWDQTSVG